MNDYLSLLSLIRRKQQRVERIIHLSFNEMSNEEFRFVFFTGDIHLLTQKETCTFCDENFDDSKALEEHLMLCGNKTEQCPRCKKFVRRAVFAYHYENNCANLNESRPIEKSKATSQRNTAMSDTIPCEFCEQNCPFEEYDQHQVRISKE